MGTVNVNRSVSDAFYRYKMPRLMAKVEGKGNGIKTVIVNMADVAKAIGRPATYPTKYFGCELGAQTQFDFKNDRFIVNGSHDAAKLQDLLDGFIRKFVLCPSCENPETVLSVSQKKQVILQACKACGYHGPLEFNHKLNTFILKNPPNINPATQGSSLTEGKRGRRSKKINGETNGENRTSDNDSEQANDTAEFCDENGDSTANGDRGSSDADGDDVGWSVDVSEAAVRARMQDLTEGAKGMTISDDLEKSEKERMDLVYEMAKRRRDAGTIGHADKELLAEAERLEVKAKVPLVLAELLFDHNLPLQIKKHRVLFLRFTHEDHKAQKYLLGGIEQVIALHKDALLPKVSGILKLFYDADILEEKVLLDWADKGSRKYVSKELCQEIHSRAEPFIKWLREAEEEESESECEDDDLEIEYDDRAKASPLKEQPKQQPICKKPVVDEEEGEDLDIDAI